MISLLLLCSLNAFFGRTAHFVEYVFGFVETYGAFWAVVLLYHQPLRAVNTAAQGAAEYAEQYEQDELEEAGVLSDHSIDMLVASLAVHVVHWVEPVSLNSLLVHRSLSINL